MWTFSIFIADKATGERVSKIVDEACLLLADYNSRLAAELEDRVTISKMLAAFIQLQKDKLAESEKKLEVSLFHLLITSQGVGGCGLLGGG